MSNPDSRAEYDRRMHRVLAHIDARIDQPIDLASLADVANFSPFHFHRLFSAWMGETVGDFLRRRRVETAAQRLLVQPRLTVLQAALGVGFGSGEAFARAFKLRFGVSPSAWRAHHVSRRMAEVEISNPGQAGSNFDQAGDPTVQQHVASRNAASEAPLNIKLVDRQPVHIAYLRYTGPYGHGVAQFWREHVYPWIINHDWLARPRYGISQDDPAVTAPAQCRYDAAVELPADFKPPRQMLTTTLPGGRHAVLPFEGTSGAIAEAWQRVMRDWLPDSGYQLAGRPGFEHYPEGSRYNPLTGVFDCEICIPLVPL